MGKLHVFLALPIPIPYGRAAQTIPLLEPTFLTYLDCQNPQIAS
jgi:hypothetical protein